MDGLETLVAPTHHAFLLTESAAAAHFNVLSFDPCLFKPSSTSSFVATHHHNHHHPQLQHLNLQATQTATQQTTATVDASSNNSNSNSNSATESNSGSNNVRNSGPTITILDNGNGSRGSAQSNGHSGKGGHEVEAAQGDLNTPVTTANDLPSFFGPSVVLEPPPITGKSWEDTVWEESGANQLMV